MGGNVAKLREAPSVPQVQTSSAVGTARWLSALLRSVGSSIGAVLMSHADQLIEIATELAMDAKDNVADLQRKLSAIETAKVEIEARLHTANHALERLSSFVSIRGSDLQCPRCWINNEVTASLRPASGGNSGLDNFRCETCKSNFKLQI
jgi:hypothetical protein